MSRIDVSSFRPPGRVFRIIAVKLVRLLTVRSLLTAARGKMKAFQPQVIPTGTHILDSTF